MAGGTGGAVLAGADAAGAFLNWLINKDTTSDAKEQLLAALGQAQGAIQTATDRGMSYQQPYLQNAGQDFSQLRGLVNSGWFQQPLQKSFTSQQAPTPSFGFNPSTGVANFGAFQQGAPGTFSPPSLPAIPNFGQPMPVTSTPQQQQTPVKGNLTKEDVQSLVKELIKNSQTMEPFNATPNNQPYTPPGVTNQVGSPYSPIQIRPLNSWKDRIGSGSTVPTFGRGMT